MIVQELKIEALNAFGSFATRSAEQERAIERAIPRADYLEGMRYIGLLA